MVFLELFLYGKPDTKDLRSLLKQQKPNAPKKVTSRKTLNLAWKRVLGYFVKIAPHKKI